MNQRVNQFDKVATAAKKRIDEATASINSIYADHLRREFVGLYREAKAVDVHLAGMTIAMGTAFADGYYTNIEGKLSLARDWQFEPEPKHPETKAFFTAIEDYRELLCNGLPYFSSIREYDY